jgi:hypothetical protein
LKFVLDVCELRSCTIKLKTAIAVAEFAYIFNKQDKFVITLTLCIIACKVLLDCLIGIEIKALRETVFAKIFAFASFGNRRFTKIRVGTSFSSFFQLVSTREILAKFLQKSSEKSSESLSPNLPKLAIFDYWSYTSLGVN